MRTRKLLSGLGATVMSLMMIIPWGGVCGQPSDGGQLHCDGKLCGGGYGGAGGHQGAEKLHPEH